MNLMKEDNFLINDEAKQKIITGFCKVADAVSGTLGPAGYNGILEATRYPFSETTNDGVSIARSIRLEDRFENIGANLAKEVAEQSDKQSRDGTTTALTIAAVLLREGNALKEHPMVIKREMDALSTKIQQLIDNVKTDITVDEVASIATISAEDESIGQTIGEIYKTIGKDGIIFRDISKTFDDSWTQNKGIQIEGAGFASPYMADADPETGMFKNMSKIKNPHVLVTSQKLNTGQEIEQITSHLSNMGSPGLVIFADEFEAQVVGNLVMTTVKRGYKMVLVKMPNLFKDEWFEDVAKLTGATFINPAAGMTLKDVRMEHIGTCGGIEVFKDEVFMDGVKDVAEYTHAMEATGDERQLIRAARLQKKTARVFVGAPTEQALSYRRLKWEDAVGASWQALHGGVVVGGGNTLFDISRLFSKNPSVSNIEMVVAKALRSPLDKMVKNHGGEIIKKGVMYDMGPDMGFDLKNSEWCNLRERKIFDPANVVKNSVRNAISVASTILTANVVVALDKSQDRQLTM